MIQHLNALIVMLLDDVNDVDLELFIFIIQYSLKDTLYYFVEFSVLIC